MGLKCWLDKFFGSFQSIQGVGGKSSSSRVQYTRTESDRLLTDDRTQRKSGREIYYALPEVEFQRGYEKKRDPGNEVDRKLAEGGPGYQMLANRHDPSQQNSTRFTGSQFVNEENGNQMTYMYTSFWASDE